MPLLIAPLKLPSGRDAFKLECGCKWYCVIPAGPFAVAALNVMLMMHRRSCTSQALNHWAS